MNFKSAITEIDNDFCDTYFAKYMKQQWGITVGFKTTDESIISMRKQLADWQTRLNCSGVELTGDNSVVVSYAERGRNCSFAKCKPVVPQVVTVTQPAYLINQFTVGAANGPVAGSIAFTPLIGGVAYLIGKNIDVALAGFLTKDTDYSFNSTAGTIILLMGRLFNPEETYTIFSY